MNTNTNGFKFSKQVNLSVAIQLILLASLIVGTWVNLQNRLVILQRDVDMLLESNKCFQQKLESLTRQTVACEYRINAIEKDN